jgi:hypothetical protein
MVSLQRCIGSLHPQEVEATEFMPFGMFLAPAIRIGWLLEALLGYREAAIQSLLHRIDSLGIPPAAREMAQRHTRHNAEQWRDDPTAATEIEARLKSRGIDATSISIEVFVQARDLFVMFDSLMHSAQSRRIVLLQEIAARRTVSSQARRISAAAM